MWGGGGGQRQTDRQRHRQTDRQTDKDGDTETDRQRATAVIGRLRPRERVITTGTELM